ncbi:MAG: hypothetical protein V1644_03115 [Candidatus Micrarchaeota archaeon]
MPSRIIDAKTVDALRRVYTDLADFIHQHELEQVIAVGPSAYPHIHAISRAYKNRHSRDLKVYSLGELGEKLSGSEFLGKRSEALALLKRHRPTLDPARRTLLFDETTFSGRTLANLKALFEKPGAVCKTATLHSRGAINFKSADFSSLNDALFNNGVRVHRGIRVKAIRVTKKLSPEVHSHWPAFMVQLHSELREIADSVPRKE